MATVFTTADRLRNLLLVFIEMNILPSHLSPLQLVPMLVWYDSVSYDTETRTEAVVWDPMFFFLWFVGTYFKAADCSILISMDAEISVPRKKRLVIYALAKMPSLGEVFRRRIAIYKTSAHAAHANCGRFNYDDPGYKSPTLKVPLYYYFTALG